LPTAIALLDVLRACRLGRLGHVDGLFASDGLLGNVLAARGDCRRGGNLHGDVMREDLELVVLGDLGVVELEDADVGKLTTEVDIAGESAVVRRGRAGNGRPSCSRR